MSIQSRIEADLSEQNTSSQSRIEQILNGEQITPRSRIEQLLQEYNPEDPGSYHKVECTKAQYDNMQSHSSNTIYVVTYPDQSVHFYLGDDEIEGEPVLITKNITENGVYDAKDESADGYSIVEVDVDTPSSDIEALEYIKSVGNSIVVTDIVPQNSWTLTADIKMGDSVSSTCDMLISAYSYTSGELSGIYNAQFGTNNILSFYIGQPWSASGSYAIQSVESEYGRMQTLTMRRGAGKSIFGSKSVQITTAETLQSTTMSLAIGGKHHNSGGVETVVPFNLREVTIYCVKLYDGDGTLIHDLIPANNTTTNRAGLYDVITGTFYPSSSSFDDFVKGPKAKGIPKVDATLTTKAITENGIYDAEDDDADGYSIVEVDVEEPSYTFKGHVALSFPTNGDGGAYIPETKLGFDTSKDFEIIVCVWIGNNYTLPSDTIFELVGTGSHGVIRKYPQLEFDNRGIWYAASSNDGASWDQTGTISASDVSSFLVQGSYNYLKLKYSVTEAKLSVWHSSDGETFAKKGEISIPNGISNTTSYSMAFGNTALSSADRSPFSDDFYIAFDKCKIISEGNVIYGGKIVEEIPVAEKTITDNGIYDASDDGAAGYSSVTVNVPTSKLYDPANAMLGYELDVTGGGMHANSSGFVSDWIDVEGASLIYLYREGSWTYGYFYNENKTPISTIIGDVSTRLSVPSGAKYMRFNDQISMVNVDNVVKIK